MVTSQVGWFPTADSELPVLFLLSIRHAKVPLLAAALLLIIEDLNRILFLAVGIRGPDI